MLAMVDMALRTDPEGKVPGRRERGEPVYTVVYHGGADGKSAWVETGKGRLEVDPESLREKVRGGARTIEALDVSGAGLCHAIRFGERGSVPEEDRDGDIPPEVMEAVLARDSHRCVICRSDRGVTVHHLESRADGGTADMKRLLSLCDRCHSEGHEQVIILRIEEDGRVTPLDAEGKEIHRQESAAEVLAEAGEDCPLETIERLEAEVSQEAGPPPDPVSSALTVDELPAEITSLQWRALEGRLEWSPTHHAFLLGPELGSALDLDGSRFLQNGQRPDPRPVEHPVPRRASG